MDRPHRFGVLFVVARADHRNVSCSLQDDIETFSNEEARKVIEKVPW